MVYLDAGGLLLRSKLKLNRIDRMPDNRIKNNQVKHSRIKNSQIKHSRV